MLSVELAGLEGTLRSMANAYNEDGIASNLVEYAVIADEHMSDFLRVRLGFRCQGVAFGKIAQGISRSCKQGQEAVSGLW